MARADRDVCSKHYGDPKKGYTYEEANRKKVGIDEDYGVHRSDANWFPAVVELDPTKESGYRVVITRKYNNR